jgi:hypothetical protein
MYLQCRFIRKSNRLYVKVTKTAILDKSFNKLREVRNRWFRGLYEVLPSKIGERVYTVIDRKGRKIGTLYKSTSHYSWWKFKKVK